MEASQSEKYTSTCFSTQPITSRSSRPEYLLDKNSVCPRLILSSISNNLVSVAGVEPEQGYGKSEGKCRNMLDNADDDDDDDDDEPIEQYKRWERAAVVEVVVG